MSNYVKATDFATKDSLTTGDPLKIIKGTEINTEFNNIQTSIATKADLASPAFTGNPTATTQSAGNNTSRLATTAFVTTALSTLGDLAEQDADDVAITGGTITGITDLAVADGGTGSSTLSTNAVLLGNGTNALQTVSPGTSGNVLTSDGTTWTSATPVNFGVDQTWQDVKASRAANTTYTNSTGKPICISVSSDYQESGSTLDILVGSVVVCRERGGSSINSLINVQAIVPDGATYRVNTSRTIEIWVELR